MKRRFFTILSAVALLVAIFYLFRPNPYSRSFDKPLPPGCRIDSYAWQRVGMSDWGASMVLSVDDEMAIPQVVLDLGLEPGAEHAANFQVTAPEIRKISEAYSNHSTPNRYWYAWVDREKSKMYLEWGKF